MPATLRPFVFICGDDDFLVARRGRERFTELAAGLTDEFSREIIEGAVQNLGELEAAIARFRAAVQTLSLFGDRKAVWLKDANFLADTPTGRAEGAKTLVAELQALLETADPAGVAVLVTACPVDRRRKELKWMQEHGDYEFLGGEGNEALAKLALTEAASLGVSFAPGALELLAGKVNGNTRLVLEETRKLATYLGPAGGAVTEALVRDLVPDFGEGDFFEPAEAFYSLDLAWTLDSLRRYFFAGHSARPLLSTLQGRNRLMLQLRVLLDSGELRLGPRGIDQSAFAAAQRTYARHFGGLTDKSTFNLFTQNLWYLGKLGEKTRALPLKRLMDFQTAFVAAFEELLARPADEEGVLRELAVRCLG
ncbi:MAG: DNA polymerase III subunit delta [Opitutales bacterium]|jgi:DNA polymerase-3 subunit delta